METCKGGTYTIKDIISILWGVDGNNYYISTQTNYKHTVLPTLIFSISKTSEVSKNCDRVKRNWFIMEEFPWNWFII